MAESRTRGGQSVEARRRQESPMVNRMSGLAWIAPLAMVAALGAIFAWISFPKRVDRVAE